MMIASYVLYAVVGYASQPSVEFYRWLRFIARLLQKFQYPPPTEPPPSPVAGNPQPEPDYVWTIGAGVLGGIVGGVAAGLVFKENPVFQVAGAYAGGRILGDISQLVRRALK